MSYLGNEIKKLGFGLMRLPMNGNEIDIEQTKAMVDEFMSKGFTYFDTAYVYGEDGASEKAAKAAPILQNLIKNLRKCMGQFLKRMSASTKTNR